MSAFIAPIISGLAGLAGGGVQQKVNTNTSQNQQGSTEQNQQGQTSGTVNPNLSPLQQQLSSLFGQQATNLASSSTNLAPYTAGGLQQIQGQGGANNQILQNLMASRGLSYSPAGTAAQAQNTLNTGNQANTFLQSIPLLQRQLQQQSLSGLISSFGALPTGTSSTGASSAFGSGSSQSSGQANQNSTISGNPLGGLLGGLGAGLFAPSGGGGGSNLSSIIGSLGSLAALI